MDVSTFCSKVTPTCFCYHRQSFIHCLAVIGLISSIFFKYLSIISAILLSLSQFGIISHLVRIYKSSRLQNILIFLLAICSKMEFLSMGGKLLDSKFRSNRNYIHNYLFFPCRELSFRHGEPIEVDNHGGQREYH